MRTILKGGLTVALGAALVLAGCGGDSDGEGAGGPNVVATTAVAADVAQRVAGPDADVTQVVSDSVSPHSYEASAQDRQQIAEADLLVSFGAGLEAGLPLQDASAAIELAEHAGPLRESVEAGVAEEPGHDDADGGHEAEDGPAEHGESVEQHAEGDDEHGPEDPHVWMDPRRIAGAMPALARSLGEVDPDNAAAYRRRAREYVAELDELDSELRRTLADVPADQRVLVTSHDSLGYFADRYGFDVVATAFGAAPEAEASARDLDAVITEIGERGVPAVFSQRGEGAEVLERIADEAGVTVVTDLLVSGFGPQAGSYPEMLRFTTERIAEALAR